MFKYTVFNLYIHFRFADILQSQINEWYIRFRKDSQRFMAEKVIALFKSMENQVPEEIAIESREQIRKMINLKELPNPPNKSADDSQPLESTPSPVSDSPIISADNYQCMQSIAELKSHMSKQDEIIARLEQSVTALTAMVIELEKSKTTSSD